MDAGETVGRLIEGAVLDLGTVIASGLASMLG